MTQLLYIDDHLKCGNQHFEWSLVCSRLYLFYGENNLLLIDRC